MLEDLGNPDRSGKAVVAIIVLIGTSLFTIGIIAGQITLIVIGVIVFVPLFAHRQLRGIGLGHPRPIIAGMLCVLGVMFLGYLTPLIGSIFVTQPSLVNISNRLVFSVTWLSVNNYPQTTQVTFNTVKSQIEVRFNPDGYNAGVYQNKEGIVYITEPFAIRDELYPPFGNWSFGTGSQVYGSGDWHIQLDYNYSYNFPYACDGNGPNCVAAFDTDPMTRTDLNGGVSLEIQNMPLNGNYNICGLTPCPMTSKNMSVTVSVALPHDTSSLQFSPTTTTSNFNQAYTNLEWDNLTSPIVLSYISPQKLAQYQFFILTSGIFISTGVAMEADAIAKWVEAKDRLNRALDNQLND